MVFEMKLMKRISKAEPHKLGLASIAAFLLVSMVLLAVSRPYGLDSLPSPRFRMKAQDPISLTVEDNTNNLRSQVEQDHLEALGRMNATVTTGPNQEHKEESNSNKPDEEAKNPKPEAPPPCDFSDRRSDVCEMEGDIRIHGNSSSLLFLPPSQTKNESWLIRPHPRKGDPILLTHVTQISITTLTNPRQAPHCTINHTIPAIIFSTGGYMGNAFHDFTDVLIPLFITSHQYDGEVQFLISEIHHTWNKKYLPILSHLSHYNIIDFNNDQAVHCFPHATVGLRSHKEMSIDPSRAPNGYTMADFGRLVRISFALQRETAEKNKKPRLLIIARKWTRSFHNIEEIVRMAVGLGYDVEVGEAKPGTNLTEFAQLVNSCDAMMGVHGAGLTNLVFLPINAVVIQVVPLGRLEGIARGDFGGPSEDLGMKYLQYSIGEEESTLVDMYPRDHAVFRDPVSIHRQGWNAVRDVYLVKQNVRLDVERFKGVLLQALELLRA